MSSRRIRSRPRLPRRAQNQSRTISAEDDTLGVCIDLTVDIGGDDVIDLTQFNTSNVMDSLVEFIGDSPVQVSSPSRNTGTRRRQRGSGRRGLHRSRSSRRRILGESITPSVSLPSSSNHAALDNSDEELPDIPFEIPEKCKQANASFVKSPPLSILCPICLDDLKQLKASKKKIMSTVCGHIFCEECITSAIRTLRSCPTCRKSLSQAKIHPLFL